MNERTWWGNVPFFKCTSNLDGGLTCTHQDKANLMAYSQYTVRNSLRVTCTFVRWRIDQSRRFVADCWTAADWSIRHGTKCANVASHSLRYFNFNKWNLRKYDYWLAEKWQYSTNTPLFPGSSVILHMHLISLILHYYEITGVFQLCNRLRNTYVTF